MNYLFTILKMIETLRLLFSYLFKIISGINNQTDIQSAQYMFEVIIMYYKSRN